MIKTRPCSFRSFHLKASKVTIDPIIMSISNAKEQPDPLEFAVISELATMQEISQGNGFLKCNLE